MRPPNPSMLDRILTHVDRGLKTLTAHHLGQRANPADQVEPSQPLTKQKARHSAGLMRVNHSGEVSAQGLYQGQALAARGERVKREMQQSADEENDHLDWCRQRLDALGSHPSYLNLVWYLGSLSMGLLAGVIGDRWSLGFVVETERQVVNHLGSHVNRLPDEDKKSLAVVEQMRADEAHHAKAAEAQGAAELPKPVKRLMAMTSKLMTKTAYWI